MARTFSGFFQLFSGWTRGAGPPATAAVPRALVSDAIFALRLPHRDTTHRQTADRVSGEKHAGRLASSVGEDVFVIGQPLAPFHEPVHGAGDLLIPTIHAYFDGAVSLPPQVSKLQLLIASGKQPRPVPTKIRGWLIGSNAACQKSHELKPEPHTKPPKPHIHPDLQSRAMRLQGPLRQARRAHPDQPLCQSARTPRTPAPPSRLSLRGMSGLASHKSCQGRCGELTGAIGNSAA